MLKRAYVEITNACNLRCSFCPGTRRAERFMTAEEFRLLTEKLRGHVKYLYLHVMGEPLLHPDLGELLSISGEQGFRVCLTTNGTALSRFAGPLREAGVDRLNVNLDTLRPDRFAHMTRTGRLEDVLRGLEAARAAGFTGTKLNVVLMDGFNRDEIPDFVELARRSPLEVRFIELMPIGQGTRERFLPAAAVLDACPELEEAESSGVARRYRIPGGMGLVGLIEPMSRRFCRGCDRIRVMADGRLKPCLHSDREIPLRGLSGEALRRAIAGGIAAKPPHHSMAETGRSGASRNMNQIGG